MHHSVNQQHQAMSEKASKWRKTNTPTKRFTNFVTEKKELPDKFRPTRDRSESVDKIFNRSRSRVNSEASIEVTQLNHTREQEGRPVGRYPSKSNEKREEMIEHVKKQVLRLNTLDLGSRQSNGLRGTQGGVHSTQLFAELKRQFSHFKQNVLHELERQKQLVTQLIKEVILTLEFELEKLGRRSQLDDPSCIKTLTSTTFNGFEPKTIEQWKSTLQNVDFSSTKTSTLSLGRSDKISKNQKAKAIQESLAPPSSHLDVTSFIGGISKLRKKVSEMEKIISMADKITSIGAVTGKQSLETQVEAQNHSQPS